MSKPGKWQFIARIALAIPMFLVTILFIVAGFKLHKHVFTIIGIVFAFLSLYCLHSLITAIFCGLMGMQKKNKCCRSAYVFCCMCFIKDTECCSSEENNRCPCFKFCCVDDIERPLEEITAAHELAAKNAFTVTIQDDHPDGAIQDTEAASSLLHNKDADKKQPPPIYKGNPAPRYEGW